MSSVKDAIGGLNRQKVKVFVLFLLCSLLAWSISKLSETYESHAVFESDYQNLPDTLLLGKNDGGHISAKLRASGFQFLNYSIDKKKIKVDLSSVLEEEGGYFITANTLKNQLERQLPNSVSLLEIEAPLYYVDLYVVASKKVPIVPKLNLLLTPNHLLNGNLKVAPDSILLKGPRKAIQHIYELETVAFELTEVSSNFSKKVQLQSLDSLDNVLIDPTEVVVSGEVIRFSEKEFAVDIKAINVPEGYHVRMFPDKVKLICKAGISRLKELEAKDFEVFVDYNSAGEDKFLFLEPVVAPEGIFSVRLLQNQVEFVLERL